MYTPNSFPVFEPFWYRDKLCSVQFKEVTRMHKFGSSLWGDLERRPFCTSICTFLSFLLHSLAVTGNVCSVNLFDQIPLDIRKKCMVHTVNYLTKRGILISLRALQFNWWALQFNGPCTIIPQFRFPFLIWKRKSEITRWFPIFIFSLKMKIRK